ncbi:leucine-rich repeat-containing protein 69 isoform X1 [Suncus etruscus]|uniref:leucine-rich repeat-containing protein 69 isoform X1 n=1 Tax=Suncus etruscus TaxID=109475 RepID=UPI00210F2AAD|nr:leucine-rich repeat-containing protein 69 isoform X1 [Suncus etruscus]
MAEKLLLRALKGGGNTKIVTLNGKRLTKMPAGLEYLTGLRKLDLQNNLISHISEEIKYLTQLTTLNLGNNHLKEVPAELKYLTFLRQLHLFENNIHTFVAEACDGLENVILLNLNNNQLTQIPETFQRLSKLKFLSINRNKLTSIPKELCFLKNLSELQLNYNKLTRLPEEIKHLKKLQKLLLVRNSLEALPEGLCDLKNLRILDIAGNFIQIFPHGFQNINLKEFYCEGNPLFLKQPFKATQEIYVWSLQEIAARFITYQLAVKNDFLMQAIKWYPQIKDLISQARTCTICGKSFLTTWLECVEFVPPNKNWKTSGNLHLVPLRVLICSYKCFGLRNKNVFGIAKV